MPSKNDDEIDKLKEELKAIERSLKEETTLVKRSEQASPSSWEAAGPSDTQQIAQELSESISRSFSNQQKIKQLEKEFHADFAQLEDSLTSDFLEIGKSLSTHREKIKSLSSQLATLKNNIETKMQDFQATLEEQSTKKRDRRNVFKSLQKSLRSLKTNLNEVKQEAVAKPRLESLEESLQQLRKTVNNLKANMESLSYRFVQKEQVQELKKLFQEEVEKIKPFIEQIEQKQLYLLNFPSGVATLLIERDALISDLLEKINERIDTKTDIPPRMCRNLRFNKLRGIVTTYHGNLLKLRTDQKIKELLDSVWLATFQLKPYWYHEDFGGNFHVAVNYANGEKAFFTVPETTSMATISDEIEERILFVGEGLQATAKQRWENNLDEGELGTVENLEFVVNGKLVEELDMKLLELQSFENEIEVQVSFSYL